MQCATGPFGIRMQAAHQKLVIQCHFGHERARLRKQFSPMQTQGPPTDLVRRPKSQGSNWTCSAECIKMRVYLFFFSLFIFRFSFGVSWAFFCCSLFPLSLLPLSPILVSPWLAMPVALNSVTPA